MNILRSAKVFVRNSFAGILSETDEGYQFTYDKSYLSLEMCETSLLPQTMKTQFSELIEARVNKLTV